MLLTQIIGTLKSAFFIYFRYYGWYSNRAREVRKDETEAIQPMIVDTAFFNAIRAGWARTYQACLHEVDPLICPWRDAVPGCD